MHRFVRRLHRRREENQDQPAYQAEYQKQANHQSPTPVNTCILNWVNIVIHRIGISFIAPGFIYESPGNDQPVACPAYTSELEDERLNRYAGIHTEKITMPCSTIKTKRAMTLMPFILVLLFFHTGSADARVWTSQRGSTVDAELVRVDGDLVILQKADGEQLRIRLADLIPADQVFARQPAVAPALPSTRNNPKPQAPVTPGNSMTLNGVELVPGKRIEYEADIPVALQKEASKDGNPTPVKSRAVIALPANFDPAKTYPVLIINATSDGDASSVGHHRQYWEAGIDRGWIVIAADPMEKPKSDNNAWRWALVSSSLESIHNIWPQSRAWPVATAGFSGGAKRSGYIGALLAKNDYKLIGMFMGGCNQDMASKGLETFKPKKSDFLRVPIFLSNGKSDTVATVDAGRRTLNTMDKSGFKRLKLETYDGGHELYKPHIAAALDWFASEENK